MEVDPGLSQVPTSIAIGLQLGNVVLESVLGEGGMGTVYLARHSVLGPRAVKVLHPGMARDRSLVARFFEEARAADTTGHPNIIRIFDTGMLPDGCTPYMVMELLKGESLADRLQREHRLPVEDAVEIGCQTASALAAAHDRKIIHRDLKPGNLFLVSAPTLSSSYARVKVLDFGIAKFFDESDRAFETKTGSLLGTPRYMSPEQCRGVSKNIDHRSDIYALGIILYEMLCGSPPFLAEGHGDLIKMHMDLAPTPPRARNPQIPNALESVILRALEKDPNERFQTMGDFERALRFGLGAPTLAIPGHDGQASTAVLPPENSHAPHTTLSGSTGQTANPGHQRKSWGRATAMIAAGVAIGAGVTVLMVRHPAPSRPSVAVQQPMMQPPPPLPASYDAAVVATLPPPPPGVPIPVPSAQPAAIPAVHPARKTPKNKAVVPPASAAAPAPSPKKSEAIEDL